MAVVLIVFFPVVALLAPKQVPIFLILLTVAVAVKAAKKRPWFSVAPVGPLLGAIGSFVLYMTMSGLWSDAPLNGLREGVKLVAFAGVAAILFGASPPETGRAVKFVSTRLGRFAPTVYAGVALVALVIGFINGENPALSDTFLARFQVRNFNEFHAIMAVFFFPVLIAGRYCEGPFKFIILPSLIIIVVVDAIWLLDLQTIKFSLVVSLVPLLLISIAPKVGKFISVVMVCMISALPFFLVELPPSAFVHLPHTLLHRIAIWDFALPYISDNFWIGIGLDGARSIPGGGDLIDGASGIASEFPEKVREIFRVFRAQYLPLHPHNVVIQIMLEGGALGISLYFFFVAVLIKTIFKYCLERFDLACAMSFLILVVTINSASFGAWQSWWWATLLLGAFSFKQVLHLKSSMIEKPD